MKRTDKDVDKVKFKKLGGGSFRMGNRIIKPGQIFSARPDEIPNAFRDVVVPVDGSEFPKEVTPKVDKEEFSYRKRETSNYYDVFDVNGNKLNDRALTKIKALDLIKELVAEG